MRCALRGAEVPYRVKEAVPRDWPEGFCGFASPHDKFVLFPFGSRCQGSGIWLQFAATKLENTISFV